MTKTSKEENSNSPSRFWPTSLVALLSGCAGLAFMLLWRRVAEASLGADASVQLSATAAMLLGLVLGALMAEPRARRCAPSQCLQSFAGLQLLAAGAALLVVLLLPALSTAALPALGSSLLWGRSLLCLSVLTPAALLLGAALPFLFRSLGDQDPRASWLLSTLLLGGAFGAPASSLWALPSFGLLASVLIFVMLAVASAGLAWRARTQAPEAVPEGRAGAESGFDRRLLLLFLAMLVLGARLLLFERVSLRALALIFGDDIRSQALSACFAVTGLAFGAALGPLIVNPRSEAERALPALLLSEMVAALACLWLIGRLPLAPEFLLRGLEQAPGSKAEAVQSLSWGFKLRCLWPVFVPMGLSLSLALSSSGFSTGSGRCRSTVLLAGYALGAALGALACASLIPNLGLQRCLELLAFSAFLIAALVLLSGLKQVSVPVWCWPVLFTVALLATIVRPAPWSHEALTLGLYARPEVTRDELKGRERKQVFYREGLNSVVSVEDRKDLNARVLVSNGQARGSIPVELKKKSQADLSTPLSRVAFPLVLAGENKSACLVGLGTGVSLGATLTYDLKSIDVVEVEAAVVAALKDDGELFNRINREPLRDPRVRIHSLDAMGFLGSRQNSYDVVSCRASHPWWSSASLLMTTEFYQRARRALTERGVLCQWLPIRALDRAGLRAGLKSFLTVFPEALAFQPPGAVEILLLGGVRPLSLEQLLERFQKRGHKGVERAEGIPQQRVFEFLGCFLSGPKTLAQVAGDADAESSFWPHTAYRVAEFSDQSLQTAQSLLKELAAGSVELADWVQLGDDKTAALLASCAETATLHKHMHIADVLIGESLKRQDSSFARRLYGDLIFRDVKDEADADSRLSIAKRAIEQWRKAVLLDDKAIAPRRSLAVYYLNQRDFKSAVAVLEPGMTGEAAHDAPYHFTLGRIYEAAADFQKAYDHYRSAGDFGQSRTRARNVADMAENMGKPIQKPQAPKTTNVELIARAGRRLLREGEAMKAAQILLKAAKLEPGNWTRWYQLAKACRSAKRPEKSLEAIERALKLTQSEARVFQLKGEVLAESGDLNGAEKAYKECLNLQSRSSATVRVEIALAEVYTGLEQYQQALDLVDRLLNDFPKHVRVTWLKGTVLAKQGRTEEARTHYQRYLSLAAKNHPMRLQVLKWLKENNRD